MATDNVRDSQLQNIEQEIQRLNTEIAVIQEDADKKYIARQALKKAFRDAMISGLKGLYEERSLKLKRIDVGAYEDNLSVRLNWSDDNNRCDVEYRLESGPQKGSIKEYLRPSSIPTVESDGCSLDEQLQYLDDVRAINRLVASNAPRVKALSIAEELKLGEDDHVWELRRAIDEKRSAIQDLEKQKAIWELNLRVGGFFIYDEQLEGRGGRKYTDTKIIYITRLTDKTMWYKECMDGSMELSRWEFSKRIRMDLLKSVPEDMKLPEVK